MKNSIKKFIEFNSKAILFLSIDGDYWVALKPICEALNIDWNRQYKNVQKDKILGDVLAKQPMHDTKNRIQNMVALPEKYVYGWLFSINSGSDAFQEYKKECYEVLYNYFHGTITRRSELLRQKVEVILEEKTLESKLMQTPEYKRLVELQKDKRANSNLLKNLDSQLVNAQLDLFNRP